MKCLGYCDCSFLQVLEIQHLGLIKPEIKIIRPKTQVDHAVSSFE
jgi:hypothetical protein